MSSRHDPLRSSAQCIPHPSQQIGLATIDDDTFKRCDLHFCEEGCKITPDRLQQARETYSCQDGKACQLTESESNMLRDEQEKIQSTLYGKTAIKAAAIFKSALNKSNVSGELTVDEETEYQTSNRDSDSLSGIGTVKAQLINAKLRSRIDKTNQGVLGVQDLRTLKRTNSVIDNKFMMYNIMKRESVKALNVGHDAADESKEEKEIDLEDISFVRKPNMARIIQEYDNLRNHPKYTLKQVVLSRRFHLYSNRFANSQFHHTLYHPKLKQPRELIDPNFCSACAPEEGARTEKSRTRLKGHRFIITADTQFGILMDGFAMDFPNWSQEIEISKKCVQQINAMRGDERPLFVCVCGDLVDTESSFSGAIASWKKVTSGWERNLVFDQQVRDFKRVWAGLDSDIALVCLCGNHDVGNRPTKASIKHWTSDFGDDYLSFWANGTFNLCLNSCLFSNPSGARDLFDEQLRWMEDRLEYATLHNATHIFVYGHFPWFLKHEEEADDYLTSYSLAPEGWGPAGSRFADGYFTVPYEQRKIAMALFKKYNVTACFSGHFHQNVVTQTSWGMPMIVTGPLSMNLYSEISHELSNGETNGIGMRIVDVGEAGKFTHKWTLLDDEEELYEHAIDRCLRCTTDEETKEGFDEAVPERNSLFTSMAEC